MLTVVLGLGSALGYALHDFLMVKVVRAAAVWTALTWSMGIGLVILLPLALVLSGPPSGSAEWRAVAFATASGVCEAAGLGALLRGLVKGNLSVVTPLASLAGGFVAVIMITRGEPLPALAAIGLPLAVVGGLMASVEKAPKEEVLGPDESAGNGAGGAAGASAPARRTRATAGAGWALLSSALCAGTMLLCVEAGALHPVALAAYGRLGTMVVLVPIALALAGLRLPRALARRAAYAGIFDAAAFVGLAAAISVGPVAIASVVVVQGGTMAAILGLLVLRERLSRVQIAGVALTCVAVALLATG
ncbi:MAG: EamA family transporter [Actinobacteria bacterium]|nr:EamA family transporter [Actinomycetota bacterium]